MKCQICEKEITEKQWKGGYFINACVVGNVINLRGHEKCLRNVDDLVVIPNRFRIISGLKDVDIGPMLQQTKKLLP